MTLGWNVKMAAAYWAWHVSTEGSVPPARTNVAKNVLADLDAKAALLRDEIQGVFAVNYPDPTAADDVPFATVNGDLQALLNVWVALGVFAT